MVSEQPIVGSLLALVVFLSTTGAPAASARVLEATENGFVSEHKLLLPGDPQAGYDALTKSIHLWWDADHSYSGLASNFSIDAQAGGCFCEHIPSGGSVAHMQVVRALPGRRLVMHGGLGPLQDIGVAGSMSFIFTPHTDGTELTYRYIVGGFNPGGGLQTWADPVDQVQLGQLRRLQRFLLGQPLDAHSE